MILGFRCTLIVEGSVSCTYVVRVSSELVGETICLKGFKVSTPPK